MSAIGSIWSSKGSVKLRSSQVIKMLLNSLIISAQEMRQANQDPTAFIIGIVQTFRDLFQPNKNLNFNDQLNGLLSTLGWKNTELSITSASTAKLVLGNNRYIDEDKFAEEDILLVVDAIIAGACYHLFDKDVTVKTTLDNLTGVTYDIEIKIGQFVPSRPYHSSSEPQTTASVPSTTSTTAEPVEDEMTSKTGISIEDLFTKLDSDQIFEPIFKEEIPKDQLYSIFKEILLEYVQSKYDLSVELSVAPTLREQVLLLMNALIEALSEKQESYLSAGHEVGSFFAQGVRDLLGLSPNELFVDEVLESADFGVVRDIHARCFCFLEPGEKCKNDNLQFCDFIMGVWEGIFLILLGKPLKFSSRIPATNEKDLYCLMEFTR